MNSNFSDKVEELEDNIDTINMKLNELKNIQRNHDNLIKRLNYNFRYDLLRVKNHNRIILMKRKNNNCDYIAFMYFIIIASAYLFILIGGEYIFCFLRYI